MWTYIKDDDSNMNKIINKKHKRVNDFNTVYNDEDAKIIVDCLNALELLSKNNLLAKNILNTFVE